MKIALIGSAPSSVGLAPYHSEEWTIWGCSPGAYGICKNPSAWFELHRYEPGQPWFSEGYCQFLRDFPGPVFMAEDYTSWGIKNCVKIPARELVEKYGPYWFNSSLSWMFAMAIEQQPEAIGLWGVDMAASMEYHSQKMGCIWFAQLAQSIGIEVGVPPESDLFVPPPLYGVCELNHAWIKQLQRERELSQRCREAEMKVKAATDEVVFLKGALDDLNWCKNTWAGNTMARSEEYRAPKRSPAAENIQPLDQTRIVTLNPDSESESDDETKLSVG